jgi:hypothetical protein
MMSHWAQIDENNIVTQVLVGPNYGDEGEAFFNALGGTWVKTSYNGNIRKNYAGIGMSYDPNRDAFISPKPFNSWLLDEDTCRWQAPIEYPTDGLMYQWDEELTDWKPIIKEIN